MIRLCGSMHEGVLNIKLLKARALLCVIFLLVLCLLRIWCKRLSTRLFRIAYSREESQINRGKITARSTNDDQYRGTNCHEIAACFGTQFWNRAKHRFRNRTKFMRNLEKRHFLTSWPVPVPDLEMTGGGGGGPRSSRPLDKWGGGGLQRGFFPPFGPQFRPKISWGGGGGGSPLDPPLMTMPFPDFS